MDLFDDILGEPAVKRARAGSKFQPKAKPRPTKKSSASVHPTISSDTKEKTTILPVSDVGTMQSIQPADVDNKLNSAVGSSLTTSAEEFTKNNEDSFSGVPILGDTTKSILVNPSAQVVATSEDVGSIDALPTEVDLTGINGECYFDFRQSETEVFAMRKDTGSMDDLHSEAAISDGNGNLHPNYKKLAKEVDDIWTHFHGHVTDKSRAGGKFQPRSKSHPRNEISKSLPSAPSNETEEKAVTLTSGGLDTAPYPQLVVAENKLTNVDGQSVATLEIAGTREPSKDNEGSFPDKRSLESIKASSRLVTGDDAGSKDALQSEVTMCDSNSGWHSSIGMLSEVDCMGFELEPFGDIYPEAASGNGNTEGENSLFHSETSILASDNKDKEENFGIPACSSVDSSALRVCDAAEPHTCSDPHTAPDLVSCREAAFSSLDRDFQIDNGRSETEEAGTFSGMETLDFTFEANIASGRHTGKFRPKPKMKTGKEKCSNAISEQVESVVHLQGPQLVPSETGYMVDSSSVPAFPDDSVQDNCMGFGDFIPSDPTSAIPMNEELRNLAETSHSDGPISGDILHSEDVPEIPVEVNAKIGKGEASTASNLPRKQKQTATAGEENKGGKSSRKLRKRVAFQLIDEPDDGANDNGSLSAEPPSNSSIDEDEDEDNDEEYRVDIKSQKKRAPRKSKKAEAENGKPVRKRKKANEAADQSTKEPRKKFSHSTRRNRRCVDKILLETPEDEIDPRKLPIKDLILLAEHKERLASKEAAASKTPLPNLSSYNSFHEESSYNGEETFASEQGRGSDDDQPSYEVQPSNPFINYQTFMDKTPSTRWSKQDTELFYEFMALKNYLMNSFSIVKQVFIFTGESWKVAKWIYLVKQLFAALLVVQHRYMLDHSHFQLVIERLQQASQAEQHSNREDSVGVTGEEGEEELTTQTNEEVEKPEQDEEVVVKDQEEDLAEVHSPLKSDASDDGLFDWSQYKINY
uniref:Uncharacterized protein n=1 Tax=Fagus sylvatica TaxID=28930 RepID=A0A2N9J4E0_FAGSY